MNTNNGAGPRTLVVGMGNVLRQDDGFGVEVARRLLASDDLPPHVTVVEVGIGGISLVQELLEAPGYDALIVLDAVEREGKPGQVYLLQAQVPALDSFPEAVRRDFLADMHYTTPERALILARALGVLPDNTWIVGCQPAAHDDFAIGLSEPVIGAIDETMSRVRLLLRQMAAPDENIMHE